MSQNEDLVRYLEELLEASRAGTLVTFVASATILPSGSNELDGRSFAATGQPLTGLSDEDVQYTMNATTVGMANAFEQIGVQVGDILRARAKQAEETKPRIILP